MDITQEEYGVFYRGTDAHHTSVIVNLTIGESAPVSHLPSLVQVIIAMPVSRKKSSRLPGENGSYASLELELISAMSKKAGVAFAARELTRGRMKFYFYAPLGTNLDPIVVDVLQSYPTFKHRISRISDPDWTIYFDELYPTRVELQLLTNHGRQAAAVGLGDCLSDPRTICHWIYFPNAQARDRFVDRVRPQGFHIHLRNEQEEESAQRQFCVELSRQDPADYPSLDELVLWLDHQAEECGGEYDSFEEESFTTRLAELAAAGL